MRPGVKVAKSQKGCEECNCRRVKFTESPKVAKSATSLQRVQRSKQWEGVVAKESGRNGEPE